MNVLAFDTATPAPSVALLAGGRLFEETLPSDRRSSEELLPAIARLLAAAGIGLADCERIAACGGPGSFTGLRIGLATAWSFGRALGIPVESVSTLEALAEAARGAADGPIHAVLDAGRGEVIVEDFALDGARVRSLGPVRRIPAESLAAAITDGAAFGIPAAVAGARGAAPPRCVAAGLALAVARAPRPIPAGAHAPIPPIAYARQSAAEEKHGAA